MSSFLFPSSAGARTAVKSNPVSRPRTPLPFLWDMRPHLQPPPRARMTAPQSPTELRFSFSCSFSAWDFSEYLVAKYRQHSPFCRISRRVKLSRCRINRLLFSSFGTLLSWSIHSAEKAAEVSRQRDNDYGHSLDRQAVSGQDLFLFPPGSHVDEPHHTDQDARQASHH